MTDSCSLPSVDSETTSLVSRSRTTHLPVPVRRRERRMKYSRMEKDRMQFLLEFHMDEICNVLTNIGICKRFHIRGEAQTV